MEKVSSSTTVGNLLNTNKLAIIGEVVFVFFSAILLFVILRPYAGDSVLLKLGIIWCINVYALLLIWFGLRLRGQNWSEFGLSFTRVSFKEGFGTFKRSLLVFTLATFAYILGTVVMSQISGMPETADMGNYQYLNNFFALLLSLAAVYIVSSFGEEVIYRAFLINRITELGFSPTLGKVIAVIVSSIVFGLAHFEWGLTGIVSTAFMGLVMALFYLKYNKNLWILVLAHVYMDTLLLVPIYLAGN